MVLADVNKEGAERVAKQLNEKYGQGVALAVHCDVTSYSSQLKAFQAARETGFNPTGRIDFVFANSGIMDAKEGYGDYRGSLESLVSRLDLFALTTLTVMQYAGGEKSGPNLLCQKVDADGPIYTSWLAIAHFRNQEADESGWRGKLVMAASEASFIPFPADILYSCAKANTLWLG